MNTPNVAPHVRRAGDAVEEPFHFSGLAGDLERSYLDHTGWKAVEFVPIAGGTGVALIL